MACARQCQDSIVTFRVRRSPEMNKYFRKNGKKIMAILGILLMIAFALPSAVSNTRRGDNAIGTIDHGKVKLTGHDYNVYRNQWLGLKRQFGLGALAIALSGIDRIDENMLIAMLGDPQASEQISQLQSIRRQNPMLYFQLIQSQPGLAALADAANAGIPIVSQFENKEEIFMILAKEAEIMGVGVNN